MKEFDSFEFQLVYINLLLGTKNYDFKAGSPLPKKERSKCKKIEFKCTKKLVTQM